MGKATTFIIKGRKRALKKAYDRSLNAKHSYYCITGDELVKSYKPFIPLLQDQVFSRGGTSYIITNIEKETLIAVKDLTQAGAEIRHRDISVLRRSVIYDDGVAYFSITEPVITKSATENVDQTVGEDLWVGSTEVSVVESAKKQFLSDWKNAISAIQKVREIEEGIMPVKTEILENEDEITKELRRLNNNARRLSLCSAFGGIQMSYKYLFDTYKKIVEAGGMRCIVNIDKKDSLDLIKVFLNAGIQVRHVKNMPPMNFGVSDKELAATIEKMEGGKMSQSFLISNEPLYINHFNSIFEELWNKGIDAVERIRDIEEGTDMADIEIIQNPREGIERAWNYVKKSKHEVLSIFSTANAFRRQMDQGLLELLKEATEERGVHVRILIPADKGIKDTIDHATKICPQVDFRVAEEKLQTRITIVLIDKKDCMIVELRDDTKDSTYHAAGLATYSNSKSIISSYVSIFESLWKQNELYEQLKIHNKMQEEFINVAAHELRTPMQPIIGLTETLRSQITDIKQLELLEITIRNVKRLMRLSDDILDVTRIEGKSLQLKKEKFNLNDVILNAMNDITLGREFLNNENMRLSYNPQDILIEADKQRITKVVSNLLDNAVKFIKQGGRSGTVIVDIEKKTVRRTGQENKEHVVVVRIKDDGPGIDPEIMPRLFTKFAAKSDIGTGLGLFISKSIIEAHGGKIWAEKNLDGKGATFTFSMPVT